MSDTIITGPADARVHGTKIHLPGDGDEPLCDSKSYVGMRWHLAVDPASATCKHCLNKVERERS